MDKASASGAGDSRFESWAGHTLCLCWPPKFTHPFRSDALWRDAVLRSYSHNLFSSVAERQLCEVAVLVSTASGGSFLYALMFIRVLTGHGSQPERSVCAVSWARDAFCRLTVVLPMQMGTWCSCITSASHAEGPGFKSQCIHFSILLQAVPMRCHPLRSSCPEAWQHNAQPSENKSAP